MKIYSLLIGFLLSCTLAIGQTECSQYHRKGCGDNKGVYMKYDGQSKSAIMAKGQKSEFHLVAYNGQDYRVSVCNEMNLGNEVQFKIYEKTKVFINSKVAGEQEVEETTTEDDYSEDNYSEDTYGEEPVTPVAGGKRPQFKIVRELLYDNAKDGYSRKIEFTAEGAMSLIIEVTVPGSNSGMKLKVRETGCVGVLIEHIKSKKTGF